LFYQCTQAKALGIADFNTVVLPQIVLTEWGWDYMADVNAVMNPLLNQFNNPQFTGSGGWREMELLWRHWWTTWTPQQAAYEQIKWAIDIYPDDYNFLLFTWSDDPNRDWTRSGTSFGNYGDGTVLAFHRLMESPPQ
jgi:hypothetical protein